MRSKGAEKIFVVVTHGLFSGDSQKMIDRSPVTEIVTTNTVDTVITEHRAL